MAYTDIDKPSDYFNTKLYTGNNADGHAITGVGFQPDFLWIKCRNVAYSHRLYDSIRGVNSALLSDQTAAENQYVDYGQLESFDSDGFTPTMISADITPISIFYVLFGDADPVYTDMKMSGSVDLKFGYGAEINYK